MEDKNRRDSEGQVDEVQLERWAEKTDRDKTTESDSKEQSLRSDTNNTAKEIRDRCRRYTDTGGQRVRQRREDKRYRESNN